jgi:hypothetical protein
MKNLGSIITTGIVVTLLTAGPAVAALAVYSKNIVDGQVKTVDLADKAVTTAKIAGNAVTGAKVDESTLGIVPNSDQLDGRDSTSFLAGPGRIVSGRTTVSRGAIGALFSLATADQIGFNVAYQCPGGSPSVLGKIEFRNKSGAAWDVWYQDGGDDPVFVEVPANTKTEFAAYQETHSVKFRITRQTFSGAQATVFYSLTGEATTCKTAGLAMLSNF